MNEENYYLANFGAAPYARIAQLVAEDSATFVVYHEMLRKGASQDSAERQSKWPAAARQLHRAQNAARKDFAKAHGWKVGESFSIARLRGRRLFRDFLPGARHIRGLGRHPDFFVDARGTPKGIVAHVYCGFDSCVVFAKREHLHIERLNDSFFDPGSANAVLYTRESSI